MNTHEIVNESRSMYGILHQYSEMNQTLDFLNTKNLKGFIEVGSANGASFHCWASVIPDGPKVSVDINLGFGMGKVPSPEKDRWAEGLNDNEWIPELVKLDFPVATEATHETVRNRNNKWREHFSDVRIVEGNCMSPNTVEKVRTILDGTLVDWVFIDAWHNVGGMITDFNNYNQFLTPEGYIGFHDIYQSKSTIQFWEIAKSTFDTIESTEGTGIGIIPAQSIIETGINELPLLWPGRSWTSFS